MKKEYGESIYKKVKKIAFESLIVSYKDSEEEATKKFINWIYNTNKELNIPIYMCLGLVVGDAVWELISPTEKKPKTFNKKVDDTKTSATTDNKTKITRLVILGVAIAVLILGFAFGGYADVLTKAVNICTECIGLG